MVVYNYTFLMKIKSVRVFYRVVLKYFQFSCPKIYNFIISHNKVLRFIIAGSIGAATDLVLLYFFTDIIGLWYVLSSIIAFLVALAVSFVLQKFWTFSDRGKSSIYWQAPWYLLIAVGNLIVNTSLVFLLVHYGYLHYLLAQIIASLLIAVTSFILYGRLFSCES